MTKSDLKSGMLVQYANGKIRLVIENFDGHDTVLLGKVGERWSHLSNWNDDLTHKSYNALDIVRVYHHNLGYYGTDISKVQPDNLIWHHPDHPEHIYVGDYGDYIFTAFEDVED